MSSVEDHPQGGDPEVGEVSVPRPRFRDRLWGLAAAVLGLVMLFAAARVGFHGARQSGWSSTDGTVTAAFVRTRTKASGGVRSTVVHRYRYEVDGLSYEGDRYSWGSIGGSDPVTAEALSRGTRVTVWHDPDAPQLAVLAREKPGKSVWLFALIGLVLAVQGARKTHAPD